MVGYTVGASAVILILLSSTAASAENSSKKLKLRDAAKRNPGSSSSLFSSILQYFEEKEDPVFIPAISLEEFANVDPGAFEWVNATEIEAGAATCGFLKAPLGSLPDVVYPLVRVYVCVRFAKNQPAPRGNLAVHCGGPGSLSSCVYDWDYDLGADNINNYNIIGFDQRGMGRTLPSFVTADCAFTTYDPDYAILSAVDFTEPSTIRAGGQVWKKRSLKCWNHPEFKMKVVRGDGTEKIYHFLEYSGTRQLAEDIERVRLLFGNQKLSIYGLSYGTKVMGLYATMFPWNVNLMVLDSNMGTGTDIEKLAIDSARSRNHRFEYFISACERNPNMCPVDNMRHCIKMMNDMVKVHTSELNASVKEAAAQGDPRWLSLTGDLSAAELIMSLIQILYGSFDKTPKICDALKEGDFPRFQDILFAPSSNVSVRRWWVVNPENTLSKPTRSSDEWPFAGYSTIADSGMAALLTLIAQDFSFGAYDEDAYVDFLYELNKKYPGADTQMPVTQPYFFYSACYQWPKITPTPPIGNPFVGGIIAGQLYDPQTPYIWTQNIRENFPSTYLLTSRSVNHGMLTAKEVSTLDAKCQLHITKYFMTGLVDFVDGTICESDPVAQSCTIDQVVSSLPCY